MDHSVRLQQEIIPFTILLILVLTVGCGREDPNVRKDVSERKLQLSEAAAAKGAIWLCEQQVGSTENVVLSIVGGQGPHSNHFRVLIQGRLGGGIATNEVIITNQKGDAVSGRNLSFEQTQQRAIRLCEIRLGATENFIIPPREYTNAYPQIGFTRIRVVGKKGQEICTNWVWIQHGHELGDRIE